MADDEVVEFDIWREGDEWRWEFYWSSPVGCTRSTGRACDREQAKSDAVKRAEQAEAPLFVIEHLRKKGNILRPALAKIPGFSALFPLYRKWTKSGA